MKLEQPSGAEVAIVRIEGNPRKPERESLRVVFPGGQVDITRAKDGENSDYWVHVGVNRPTSGWFCPGDEMARVIDARIDAHDTGTGSSWQDAAQFNNPNIYHVAIRVAREIKRS